MVSIVEIFEAEDLKPLQPGKASHISGKEPDPRTLKALNKIDMQHGIHKTALMDIGMPDKWSFTGKGWEAKTKAEREEEQQLVRLTKNEMNALSLEFVRDVRQAVPFIQKNCSKFLPTMHNEGFLYRGFSNIDSLPHAVFYGRPRADRLPRDSDLDLQKMFDLALDMIGIMAKRGESLFVTGQKEQAVGYGLPFIIIPCNDAHYAWSRNIHDIILDKHNNTKFLKLVEEYYAHRIDHEDFAKEFQKIFFIVDNELDQAMRQTHEIWFSGHYVAILATLEPQLRTLLFGK